HGARRRRRPVRGGEPLLRVGQRALADRVDLREPARAAESGRRRRLRHAARPGNRITLALVSLPSVSGPHRRVRPRGSLRPRGRPRRPGRSRLPSVLRRGDLRSGSRSADPRIRWGPVRFSQLCQLYSSLKATADRAPPFPPSSLQAVRERLMTWFELNARPLPWRETRDPYAILVSEVMLQQN